MGGRISGGRIFTKPTNPNETPRHSAKSEGLRRVSKTSGWSISVFRFRRAVVLFFFQEPFFLPAEVLIVFNIGNVYFFMLIGCIRYFPFFMEECFFLIACVGSFILGSKY